MQDFTVNLTCPAGPEPETPACVVQIHGEPLGRRVQLLNSELTFGRVDGNGVVVPDKTVSRHHARLVRQDGVWWIEDLGSRNGTLRNGARVANPTRLNSGDKFKVGRAVFKFLASGDVEALFHEAIHEMALSDGLTGVANRRHLDEFIQHELMRVQRQQSHLAVIMFDLDHFKRVNDQYGHVAGDEVLRLVCTVVGAEIRSHELIGRYGGEEFMVVLPDSTRESAAVAAERFRALIEASPVRVDQHTIMVTASFGVALSTGDDTVSSLVKRADKGLYEAKCAGRNRVVSELAQSWSRP